MIHNYFKKAIIVVIACIATITKAQIVFYSENFNSGAPSGYSSTSEWVLDDIVLPNSSGYTGASGSFHYAASNGSTNSETLTVTGISTLAYINLSIQWGAYKESSFPGPVTFQWSSDGTTWNTVAYTDVSNNSTWALIPAFSLPAGAAGQANLRLRWIYTANNNGFFYALDDVNLSGTISQYFSKSSGNLDVLANWGTNGDGTGTAPSNFTSANITYNIVNNSAPTIGANWTVSGSGSKVVTGSATFNTNFTIPSGFNFTGTIDVSNSSTLTIQNATFPPAYIFGTLGSSSTVNYAAAGSQTMTNATYGNLTISGSGSKTYTNNITVGGALDISAGTLAMQNNSFRVLTLNGTISGAGTISGNTGARLTIGGTSGGNAGTLNFTAGSRTLHTLSVNRTGANAAVTLGTDLVVNTNFPHTNGILNLNGQSLTMRGSITFPASGSGSMSGSTTSSVSIINSGAISGSMFMDQTSSTTKALGDLTLDRTGGVTLTLGNALDIYGAASPSVGTLATGGFLTLKSNSSNKGRIGIIDAANGTLSGNVTVEVFKPAGVTGWVNLCSGGVTGQTFSNWNTSFAITCPTCPDGSSVGGQTFTSVYSYDETLGAGSASNSAHYVQLPNITTAINSYMGYWVFLGNGFPNTSAMTIPLTGAVNTKSSGGSYNLTLTGGVSSENGWNLISNPYPSPILVSQFIASAGGSNIDNTLLVYDPDTDSNIPMTSAGSNSIIAMGQAFMVRALVNGVSVTPSETWKTTTNSNVSIEKSIAPNYYFNDFLLDLTSTSISKNFFSQAYFTFGNGGTTGFDNGMDAYSIASSIDDGTPRIFSIVNNGNFLRSALPSLNGVLSIPIKVTTGYAGVYSINPVNLSKLPAGACVALYDIANNITHDLKTGPYTTTIAANASTHQFELKITLNPSTLVSNVNNPVCAKNNTGYISAKGTSAGPWNYLWKDASNNVIKTTNNIVTADTLKNIVQGTYKVDVTTVGACDNANASFNVQATTPLPVAMFGANAYTIAAYSNVPVSFTNNSSNASTYTWYFGDNSAPVNTPNATHVFNDPATYMVSLIATNGACADTSVFSAPISVMQFVGVSENILSENNFFVSKDENGVFVQLNFNEFTTADISVTNILGQKISKQQIVGESSKTYLAIPENEKIVFVTVVANGKKQTKKFIN